MNEQQVLQAIADGENAESLLLEKYPNAAKDFKRLCKQIITFEKKVKRYFPDAQYYTASGGFNLMLGRPHNDKGNEQSRLLALGGVSVYIGDGDF